MLLHIPLGGMDQVQVSVPCFVCLFVFSRFSVYLGSQTKWNTLILHLQSRGYSQMRIQTRRFVILS